MPDGICMAGKMLHGDACGSWNNPMDGSETPVPNGLSDEEMYDAGYECGSSCEDINNFHIMNADPNGGPGCQDVYSHYNFATTCCPECGPMPDGICEAGRMLHPGACGVWHNPDGTEAYTNGLSDAEMYDAGYECTSSCEDVDNSHKMNADPNGGPGCQDVYGHYNYATNCCPEDIYAEQCMNFPSSVLQSLTSNGWTPLMCS
jgi:hypothetical protein